MMPRRLGTNKPVLTQNQENVGIAQRTGKPQVPVFIAPIRRAALGEVGNKLNAIQTGATKKIVIDKKAAPVKENVVGNLKKVTTKVVPPVDKLENAINQKMVVFQPIAAGKAKNIEKVSYSSKQILGVHDADAADSDDPMAVSEYTQDIFGYLQELERKYSLPQNFLSGSKSSPRMRSVVINWIVEVHMNFKALLETLHLATSIIDRYLTLTPDVGRHNLQLVGASALHIASKYEEIYPPEIDDFVYICDETYTKKEIKLMERDILTRLKFFLGKPLSIVFLRRYNKVAKVESSCHYLGKYLLEICLLEYDLCQLLPSIQAAAACCLSMSILNEVEDPSEVWSKTMVYYTSYKYSQIKSAVQLLAHGVVRQEKSKFKMVKTKYENSKLDKISAHPNLKGKLVLRLASEAAPKQ